ncbi:MAG: DUF3300 domain-containing protein [Opitutaceae bacterium]|nr:DUF3300 domain-containing protein [Opitutaceae bacterium]
MKTLRLLFCLVPLLPLLPAQEPEWTSDATATVPLAPVLTPEQLDQLLAPIALYPDALIALILPAATNPADIVLAARHLKETRNDLSQVEHRAWDDSVKSLTHYPEVLQWMDDNLPWTKQVGETFLAQPAEVMNSIQRLRARAQASGALASTPQQQVLAEPTVIRIVPTDPEIIYVPRYDPTVIFIDRPLYYSQPLLTFGLGWHVGSWLAYDFDWHRCTLWVGDRHRHWTGRHDWRRPVVPIPAVSPTHAHVSYGNTRPWRPPVRFHRPQTTQTTLSVSSAHPPSPGGALSRGFGRNGETEQRRYDTPRTAPSSRSGTSPRTVVSPPRNDSRIPSVAGAPLPVAPPLQVVGPRSSTYPTVVAPPANQPAASNSNPRSPSQNRQGQNEPRYRGRAEQTTSTTTASPLPVAPPLRVVGPTSAVQPTVVAAPPANPMSGRSSHNISQSAHQSYAGPRAAPTQSAGRTFARPSAPVVAAPSPVVASAPTVNPAPPAVAPRQPDSRSNNAPPSGVRDYRRARDVID